MSFSSESLKDWSIWVSPLKTRCGVILKWCKEPEGLIEHIELWFSGLSRCSKNQKKRTADVLFMLFTFLFRREKKSILCLWISWTQSLFGPCSMKLKALTHMWTIYGPTTPLPKVGVTAEMWDNVWDRQAASRLRLTTVHTTTPNLTLEPKAGSIYIKTDKEGRKGVTAPFSKTSESHLPTKTPTEGSGKLDWKRPKGPLMYQEIHFTDGMEKIIVCRSLSHTTCSWITD